MQLARANGKILIHDNGSFYEALGITGDIDTFGVGAALDQLSSITKGALVETPTALEAPLPRPEQLFAVGLNYRNHAHEMDLPLPTTPMVFTKFPSCIGDPNTDVSIPGDTTDWEAELVIVIGTTGRNIPVQSAMHHVAGYMVGQDVSERTVQMSSTPAQFSLGKSYRNFAPMGPWLTTADEIADPNNLQIECALNGQMMQDESTSDMAFSVPEIVAYISTICELRRGDLIFTGSPAGVGQGQNPKRFLVDGDVLVTSISGLGTITNTFVEEN